MPSAHRAADLAPSVAAFRLRLGRARSSAAARSGTTTTPSSSPHGPVARLDPHAADRARAPASPRAPQRHVESSGVTKREKTGKPSSRMKRTSRHPPSRTQPATPRAFERGDRELAEVGRDAVGARVDGHVAPAGTSPSIRSTFLSASSWSLRLRRPPPDGVGGAGELGRPAPGAGSDRRQRLRRGGRGLEAVRERGRVDRLEALPHGAGIPRSGGRSSPRPSTSSGACSASRRSTSSARRTRSRPSLTAMSWRCRPAG